MSSIEEYSIEYRRAITRKELLHLCLCPLSYLERGRYISRYWDKFLLIKVSIRQHNPQMYKCVTYVGCVTVSKIYASYAKFVAISEASNTSTARRIFHRISIASKTLFLKRFQGRTYLSVPIMSALILFIISLCSSITSVFEGKHYSDVIMSTVASQITSLTIVCSTVSGADQRKHQSSASLAFVWGIHRSPVNSPHKGPVTREMFAFDDVIMITLNMAAVENVVAAHSVIELICRHSLRSGRVNYS